MFILVMDFNDDIKLANQIMMASEYLQTIYHAIDHGMEDEVDYSSPQ